MRGLLLVWLQAGTACLHIACVSVTVHPCAQKYVGMLCLREACPYLQRQCLVEQRGRLVSFRARGVVTVCRT